MTTAPDERPPPPHLAQLSRGAGITDKGASALIRVHSPNSHNDATINSKLQTHLLKQRDGPGPGSLWDDVVSSTAAVTDGIGATWWA